MHDFKALPHQNKPHLNDHASANSSPVLQWDMVEKQNAPHDPQIPHYFWKPVDQYIIALVGFLEAQGVRIYNSVDRPDFAYTTTSKPPTSGFLVVGMIFNTSYENPSRLLLSTVYVPDPERWNFDITLEDDAFSQWLVDRLPDDAVASITVPRDDFDDDDDDRSPAEIEEEDIPF